MQILINWFKSLPNPNRIYLVAALVFSFALFLQSQNTAFQVLLLLSYFGFALGFLLRSWPHIVKIWGHVAGRTIIIIVNLFVLVFAAALARNVVASALKLPPQNFEIALSFVTLLFYIPAWSIVVCVVVGIIALLHELVAILGIITKRADSHIWEHFAHMVGAIVVCVTSAIFSQFSFNNKELLHPTVRWVAFFGDYQVMDLYPGNSFNERVRLHDNGVISSARIEKDQIVISVRKYEDKVHNLSKGSSSKIENVPY